MLKSNTVKDSRAKGSLADSDAWDNHYDSDTPAKMDRINRKKNADARRRYENLKEDMQLKALIDGDRWF